MSGTNRYFNTVCFLAAIGSFGCAQTKPQAFQMLFLPPAPRAASVVAAEPPALDVAVADSRETPRLLTTSLEYSPRQGRTDAAIREAEAHFQAGKKRYREGDEDGARLEFDRAIDVLLSAPENAPDRPTIEKKLDDLVETIHRFDLTGMGIADIESDPGFEKPPLEDIPTLTFPIDPKLKNKVLEEVRATASQLPLQANEAVLSYIHYFSSERGRKKIVYGFRRAGRYRPMIRRILDEEGVPQELIYLAQVESGFAPRALSNKQAAGMWQFLRSRGNEYGLMQSAFHDERLDPEKATRAAARHLRDLYHRYGDWYLAIAAYNCGPGCVDRAVQRTGYADFWELRRREAIPKETVAYVPAVLAITIMAKNAKEYGIDEIDPDPPLEYESINIAAPTNLLLLADLADCPVSQVRELNPALLKNMAPPGVQVRVPKGTASVLSAALESIPEGKRAAWRAHRFGEGESLGALALRYRVTEESILAANQPSFASAPETGDLILIPAAPEPEPRTLKARSTKHTAARRHGSTRSTALKSGRRGASRASGSRTSSSHARSVRAAANRKTRTISYTASNVSPGRHHHVKR
jgi:membrane-bound lytic murein transglycosylase D